MSSPHLPTAVNATKQLCAEVMAVADPATNPPASRRVRVVMGSSAERLFGVVIAQLTAIFDEAALEAANGQLPSSRGCKFALNVMLQGLSIEEIAGGLPQGTLRTAISLLLCRLVDERGLLMFEEGPTLVRAVNVLIAKMLDSANRNYSFAALLQLLRAPPPGVPPQSIPKFNDLVVKCLIKLTKGLQTDMSGVDVSGLLLNIHDFFMFLGVDEIRRRSSSDDKPLRMVKTVLHELCKMSGHSIYVHAASIPGRKADPQPIIFAYISLNLSSLEASGLIAPATGEEQGDADLKQQQVEAVAQRAALFTSTSAMATAGGGIGGSTEASATALPQTTTATATQKPSPLTTPHGHQPQPQPSPEVQAAAQKAEVKARLKGIMTRLVQRDTVQQKAAMADLYRLRREQPQYVERYIAGTSDMFRQFIAKGLDELEQQQHQQKQQQPHPQEMPRVGSHGGMSASSVVAGVATVTAGGPSSTRSDGSQSRLSSLRERLSSIKAMSGSNESGGAGAAADAAVMAVSSGAAASVEELSVRLQNLRRTNSSASGV